MLLPKAVSSVYGAMRPSVGVACAGGCPSTSSERCSSIECRKLSACKVQLASQAASQPACIWVAACELAQRRICAGLDALNIDSFPAYGAAFVMCSTSIPNGRESSA